MKKHPLGTDESTYRKRNLKEFIRKMKQDRSWRKGFKAAKRGLSVTDNPYKLSDEIWTLLRKRTKWILGYEEWQAIFGKKHRLDEIAKEKKRYKKELKKQNEKLERIRERNKHKQKKTKHGKKKRHHTR